MKTCAHWQDAGNGQGGKCLLHGKVCSFGVCAVCPDSTGEVRWWLAFRRKHRLGDKVERVARAVGVKPCHGCKGRKAYLNGERA